MLSTRKLEVLKPANKMQVEPEERILLKRIGSTTYRVGVQFSRTSGETLEEKVLRLMKNDLNFTSKNATMESLQASGLHSDFQSH